MNYNRVERKAPEQTFAYRDWKKAEETSAIIAVFLTKI
jgi:hypothetical protein